MTESEKPDAQLTREERAYLENADPGDPETERLVIKLFLIHDAQAVEIANLKFRLGMVTADPLSQGATLLSKHNALKLASENLDHLRARVAEADALLRLSGSVERDMPEYIDRVEAWLTAEPPRALAKGRFEIESGAIQTRADADRFRGMVDYDFLIKGDRDTWFPWNLLQYLVVDVLAPSGGDVRAEDERLMRLPWWPRKAPG